MNRKLKRFMPLTLFIVVLIILLGVSSRYINVGPVEIQRWINSFGIWGPVLFILLYTARPLILFPASILSLAGGLAFGAGAGFIYIVIGATLSSIVAFQVSKTFQASFLKSSQDGKLSKIKDLMEKRGFLYVLVLRLIPLVNFDLISYAAGLANVRLRAFVLATVIGIMPGTFAFSFLGSSFVEGNPQIIFISAVIFAILLIVPILFRKKVSKWTGLDSNTDKKRDDLIKR
ncbi:TVP38/TMEM64 family protein [Jeotgalibacillus marinus]|uniref:TVP38/TMEM64 family membrane protein n=1 Tax=Jeotgalibacillus marinus TaxID=86667 RepID=A0ABV3Q6S6_9BACL